MKMLQHHSMTMLIIFKVLFATCTRLFHEGKKQVFSNVVEGGGCDNFIDQVVGRVPVVIRTNSHLYFSIQHTKLVNMEKTRCYFYLMIHSLLSNRKWQKEHEASTNIL